MKGGFIRVIHQLDRMKAICELVSNYLLIT